MFSEVCSRCVAVCSSSYIGSGREAMNTNQLIINVTLYDLLPLSGIADFIDWCRGCESLEQFRRAVGCG